MFIKQLELNNYRMFKTLNISFQDKMNVLVGRNGSGKSTVLEALSLSLSAYIAGLNGYKLKKFGAHDAHNQAFDMGSVLDIQPQFPVNIKTTGTIDGRDIEWNRIWEKPDKTTSGVKGTESLREYMNSVQQRVSQGDKNMILPVVAYYDTKRLWGTDTKDKKDDLINFTRLDGYKDALNAPLNNNNIKQWFKKMAVQDSLRGSLSLEYAAVRKAIELFYSGLTGSKAVNVKYNIDTNDIDIFYTDEQDEKKADSMSSLSDGYRCAISLIADIAYRMAILNPQLLDKVLDKVDGVVLIDEVDLHLHPAWQQRILGDLMAIFPKVQFVVTTHAPIIINSVNSENLIILEDGEATYPAGEVYGKDVNTIIRGVMGTVERPVSIKKMFDDFYVALANDKIDSAKKILDELESKIGNDDADLAACQVKIKLKLMREGKK